MPTATLLFKTAVGLTRAIFLDLLSLLPFQLTTSKTRDIFLSLPKCSGICCKVQMTLKKSNSKKWNWLLHTVEKPLKKTDHYLPHSFSASVCIPKYFIEFKWSIIHFKQSKRNGWNYLQPFLLSSKGRNSNAAAGKDLQNLIQQLSIKKKKKKEYETATQSRGVRWSLFLVMNTEKHTLRSTLSAIQSLLHTDSSLR